MTVLILERTIIHQNTVQLLHLIQMIKILFHYTPNIYKMKTRAHTLVAVILIVVNTVVQMTDMEVPIDMVALIIYIQVNTVVIMITYILVNILHLQPLLLPPHTNGLVPPTTINILHMTMIEKIDSMMTEEIDSKILEVVSMINMVLLTIYLMIVQKNLPGSHLFSKKEVVQKLVIVKMMLEGKLLLKF